MCDVARKRGHWVWNYTPHNGIEVNESLNGSWIGQHQADCESSLQSVGSNVDV